MRRRGKSRRGLPPVARGLVCRRCCAPERLLSSPRRRRLRRRRRRRPPGQRLFVAPRRLAVLIVFLNDADALVAVLLVERLRLSVVGAHLEAEPLAALHAGLRLGGA